MRRLIALLLFMTTACGADGVPAPVDPPRHEGCGSPEELAPSLGAMLREHGASSAGSLLDRLSTPTAGSEGRSPVSELLRALFVILGEYARDPAEAGGAPCAPTVPGRGEPYHRACLLRRLLEPSLGGSGVAVDRQLLAFETLHALRPMLGAVLSYAAGAPPRFDEDGDGDFAHPALFELVYEACQQDGVCRMGRMLELGVALTEALAAPGVPGATGGCAAPASGAETLVCRLEALVLDPDFSGPQGFSRRFAFDGEEGREGFTLLLQLLGEKLDEAPRDAHYFDGLRALSDTAVRSLLVQSWPDGTLVANYDALVAELEALLEPSRGLLAPLQDVLRCLARADARAKASEEARLGRALPGPVAVVAIHALLFGRDGAGEPLVSVDRALATTHALLRADPDAVLLRIGRDLLASLLAHGELHAEPSAALPLTCRSLFEREAVHALLPFATQLVERRLLEELVCLGDVVLYGCGPAGTRPSVCTLASGE